MTFASILPDIAPVCEGAVQHIASKRLEIGGVDLTNLFAQELKKSNPSVNLDVSDVERLKEQYACCAEDQLAFEAIGSSCQPEKHTLPDGQVGYYTLFCRKSSVKHTVLSYCVIDFLHKFMIIVSSSLFLLLGPNRQIQ